MSQADIDSFIDSARDGTLTPHDVSTAVARGIPMNARHSDKNGVTALHYVVDRKRHDLVVALLAVGADANVKSGYGYTLMWMAAANINADILQLLTEGGGNVNETNIDGETPLIALVKYNYYDVAARLQVLLMCPELVLDAEYYGKTTERWAVSMGHFKLASAIAEERVARKRWGNLRSAWIGATVAPDLLQLPTV
jgi:hypothetical protein